MSASIIDWLAFSFSPEPIQQLKEFAKHGVLLAETCVLVDDFIDEIDLSNYSPENALRIRSTLPDLLAEPADRDFYLTPVCGVAYQNLNLPSMMQYLHKHRISHDIINNVTACEFSRIYAKSISSGKIAVNTEKFSDNWLSCISSVGVQALDNLCATHIDDFMFDLSTFCSKPDNFWSLIPRTVGMFGYEHSAFITVNGVQCGAVAWGAKNHGCYVSFSGLGCAALDMSRVYAFLRDVVGVNLTRVDVAYDDFYGKRPYDHIQDWYCDGLFMSPNGGKMPSWNMNHSGTGKKLSTGKYGMIPTKGRCFYVGDRTSGKLFRGYEKGKQLKSEEFPDWMRYEVELHNKSRKIPLEILIQPDEYLAGSYPALKWVLEETNKPDSSPIAVPTQHRVYTSSYEKSISHAAVHTGKTINYMLNVLGLSKEQIFDRLTNHLDTSENTTDIPEHLFTPNYLHHPENPAYDDFIKSVNHYVTNNSSNFQQARLAYLESLNEE